jgi:hypothetical protein
VDTPSLIPNEYEASRRSCCFPPAAGERWSSPALELPSAVPFLDWRRGQAVFVPTGPERLLLPGQPVADVVAGRGHPPEAAVDAVMTAAARRSAGARLPETVGAGFLVELWLTGVALGMCAGGAARPAEDALRQALRTVAPGGLWRFATVEDLLRHAEELAALVGDGIRIGGRREPAAAPSAEELIRHAAAARKARAPRGVGAAP